MQKLKNNESRPKFTGSYKKKRVYQTMKHYKPVENLQKNIPRKAEMYFIQSGFMKIV